MLGENRRTVNNLTTARTTVISGNKDIFWQGSVLPKDVLTLELGC